MPEHASASPPASFLGVDVGGTKTHLAAVRESGDRIDSIVPSASWCRGDLFADPANLERLAELLAVKGATTATRIVVGMHGCDTPEQVADAAHALSSRLGSRVLVANDGELLSWAAGIPASIQVVVGTGSVVLGRTAEGELVTALGSGWLFSDDGSAPALVRESIREVLRRGDADALGDDPLPRALFERYGVADLPSLALAATRDAGPTRWGAHAPLVFEMHEAGSDVARAVVDDAGRRIAAAILAVLSRGAQADAIVVGGGVIVGQSTLRVAVSRALAEAGCVLPLSVVTEAPVEGALAWARALDAPADVR